jgi:hypothetical protein
MLDGLYKVVYGEPVPLASGASVQVLGD